MIVDYPRSIGLGTYVGGKLSIQINNYRTYDELEPSNFHFFNEDELDTFPSVLYDNDVGAELRKEVSLE